VARVAVCLAEEMGLARDDLETIYLGGLLHDIGKIGIDDHVLNKAGALTPEEFEQIKKHPQLGYDILRGVRQLQKILPIVLHHHETWDGAGYPHGLKGDSTPLLARIAAVADAFDAMSSDRPYRRGMPDEKLDAILREGAGKQWDPDVIDAFFACRDKIRQASHDGSTGAVPLDPLQWVH
jgi:putative nucleotidyltransferase with HDIG domain